MKNTKLLLLFLAFLGAFNLRAQMESFQTPDGLTWYTDMVKAGELSKETNKPVFAFFTGSDWCGWCKKLQKDVFEKPEFVQWAKDNVILVELDFPRAKPQSAELKQQNMSLQQAFQVQGYPTIWMFFMTKGEDAKYNIDNLGSLGYPTGAEKGKEQVKFLENANAILANKKNP